MIALSPSLAVWHACGGVVVGMRRISDMIAGPGGGSGRQGGEESTARRQRHDCCCALLPALSAWETGQSCGSDMHGILARRVGNFGMETWSLASALLAWFTCTPSIDERLQHEGRRPCIASNPPSRFSRPARRPQAPLPLPTGASPIGFGSGPDGPLRRGLADLTD